MKRDFELIREILLAIEEQHTGVAIYGFKVEGYDLTTVAYHCKLLEEVGFISAYKASYADNAIYNIAVGGLTWEGNDYLDKVRDNTLWKKTKDTIKKKGLPLLIDTIKSIATAFITAAAEGVANSIIKNGGQV